MQFIKAGETSPSSGFRATLTSEPGKSFLLALPGPARCHPASTVLWRQAGAAVWRSVPTPGVWQQCRERHLRQTGERVKSHGQAGEVRKTPPLQLASVLTGRLTARAGITGPAGSRWTQLYTPSTKNHLTATATDHLPCLPLACSMGRGQLLGNGATQGGHDGGGSSAR